jgi:hypothetical protein
MSGRREVPPLVEQSTRVTSRTAKPANEALRRNLAAAKTQVVEEAGGVVGIRSDGCRRHSLKVPYPGCRHGHHDLVHN